MNARILVHIPFNIEFNSVEILMEFSYFSYNCTDVCTFLPGCLVYEYFT